MTNHTTYATIERALIAALHTIAPEDLPTVSEAKEVRAATRGARGFVAAATPLLTAPDGNAKYLEGDGAPVYGLAFAPFTASGRCNICPFEDHCAGPCVANAGNGGFSSTTEGRGARVDMLIDHPRHFLALLVDEITRAVRKHGAIVARLNTFSDLRWERILPVWFWSTWGDAVTFYDYTKHPLRSRPAATLPANYRLTYSVSPRSTAREISAQRATGRPVAVVVAPRGGKDRTTGERRPLPTIGAGAPVVDGDANDRRSDDPAGAVVMLRRKGTLAASDPLVVGADRLADLFGGAR